MSSLKLQIAYFILFLGKHVWFCFCMGCRNLSRFKILKKWWKIIAFLTKFLKLQQATTLKLMLFSSFLKDFWVSWLWSTVLRMISTWDFWHLDSFSIFESYGIWQQLDATRKHIKCHFKVASIEIFDYCIKTIRWFKTSFFVENHYCKARW